MRYLVICLTLLALLISLNCFGDCWWNDDFTGADGDPPNSDRWIETDVNNAMEIKSNALYFQESGPGAVFASLMSKWVLPTGDFDIQLDFNPTILPDPINGVNYAAVITILNSDFSKNIYIGRAREGSFGGDGINGYVKYGTSDAWVMHNSAIDNGKLRIKRVGSTFIGYYWNDGEARWEWNGDTAGYTFTTTWSGDTYVNPWFEQEDDSSLESYMDNFTVTVGCGDEYIAPKLIMITKNKEIK